ncbi:Trm112 family protein [Desulfonatronospira sp.]|uniref:Trm112 family protein n=1 Tax=Desulfonatronospira sp. TaxID=1962951 RepID=UPI0025BA8519|nr:Trm112 family protein [Desulfonatronospira sp.]
MSLNKELLQILACPKCRSDLSLVGEEEGLQCVQCALVYPIREEIPVMLIHEAIPSGEWEKGIRTKD